VPNFSEQDTVAQKRVRLFTAVETFESQIRDALSPDTLCPSAALFDHPIIIQVAAFVSSVRCFAPNGADQNHSTSLSIAVRCGN
jgi:hypothetical protein